MSFGNGRTHYFHADATAIGGQIERPFVKNVPVQAPVSLAPAGGETDGSGSKFSFEEVVSADATRTHVEGHFLSGLATTRMTALVEGLNVLDRVRASQLLAYISAEHPGEDPDVPRVTFGKTRITDLRVDDSTLEVILDLDLLNGGNGKGFPKKPHVEDKALWNKVGQQYDEKNGILVCSLVKKINVVKGKLRGKLIRPNIIEITDFGRVHLAELLVSYHSFQLIMMRFELGCPTKGALSASAGKVNGGGGP
jgi:hypothetical protein